MVMVRCVVFCSFPVYPFALGVEPFYLRLDWDKGMPLDHGELSSFWKGGGHKLAATFLHTSYASAG